ncbi:MAG: carbohydrate ABC transporter permease [Caldilineaceae bacterium]|nr:carbohydrate ABC transporter permease [Caldilineaceae bacterium]
MEILNAKRKSAINVPTRVRFAPYTVLRRLILYVTVISFSLLFAAPLIWMISTSLKTDPQVYHVPPIWIPNPIRLANYPEALSIRPFGIFTLNTLRYALTSTVGAVMSAAVVAYGFSRLQWPGRNVLFFLCLATMMIPFQVRMVPLYITFKNLDWLNSYKPLIIPAFLGIPYYIFLLRQFFLTIPQELSDAARVDGANELNILLRIILPLAKPALAVVGLLQFMAAWDNFLGPLIYLSNESLFPIALGLRQLRSDSVEALMWPYMMAASTMTILPVVVLFFFVQRTFVEGISITGIKG